jgi:hypothetical protein
MLYFSGMTADHELWSNWVIVLREKGLNELVAWLLQAGEPLSILLSQMITIMMPLVSSGTTNESLNSLITVLEDRAQLIAFSEALQTKGGNG